MNNKITFISAQPDTTYFHWQVEVMIHNFMKVGVNPNWIEVLFAYDYQISEEGRKLADRYPYVRFFFYKKSDVSKNNEGYIPMIRPDILSQHFKIFKNLEKEPIFYHDSDIIFRELPNFDSLSKDKFWYLSDTVSYIGSEYIKSKSENLLKEMCKIANIPVRLVEKNNTNSGGAQYLMKNIDYRFWHQVSTITLNLYKFMRDRELEERKKLSKKELKDYNPIQKWCADMWGVLWTALKNGHSVKISKELDFSWATGNINDWEKCKIYHNAGVTIDKNSTIFYKGDFTKKMPWNVDFSYVSKESNSYNYVEAILYAKKIKASLK